MPEWEAIMWMAIGYILGLTYKWRLKHYRRMLGHDKEGK